jgi:hypothetical protein
MRVVCIILLFQLCVNTIHVIAAETPVDDSLKKKQNELRTTQARQQQDSIKNSKQNVIVVYDVFNYKHPDPNDIDHYRAALGDKIRIHVKGMTALLGKAAQQKKDIKLFLDHRQVDDIKPISGAPDKDDGYLEFTLERTSVNDKVWTDILGKPVKNAFFYRPTEVSVGVDGTYAEDTDAKIKMFELVRIRKPWFYGGLIFLAAYLILLFYLGTTKDILRETGVDLTGLGLSRTGRLPFSLGKVQMAFWFSLVLGSFLFIWMVTGNYDIITSGVLGLIGISATTALGAVTIDDNKGTATITDILTLRRQRDDLTTAVAALVPPNPDITVKTKQLNDLQAAITQKENSLELVSQGFIDDILTDINGISFHRLQMFIWTIVLGLIFVYSVWASLIMPDFSATLLTLQGITAGTYLGFKFPEKQG